MCALRCHSWLGYCNTCAASTEQTCSSFWDEFGLLTCLTNVCVMAWSRYAVGLVVMATECRLHHGHDLCGHVRVRRVRACACMCVCACVRLDAASLRTPAAHMRRPNFAACTCLPMPWTLHTHWVCSNAQMVARELAVCGGRQLRCCCSDI